VIYANATLAALLRRAEEWPADACSRRSRAQAPADPNLNQCRCRAARALAAGDGTTVECERWAVLLPDSRLALHYRPMPKVAPGALAAAVDRSSGLSTPEHLLEVLRRDWSIAQRDARNLTMMRFDLDGCRDYLEVFGRGATENVLRQVGRTIASAMRRTSDVVRRFDDDEFVVLGVSMEADLARQHAEHIVGRVRALAIHHPRSRTGRYLTLSGGVVTTVHRASRLRGAARSDATGTCGGEAGGRRAGGRSGAVGRG